MALEIVFYFQTRHQGYFKMMNTWSVCVRCIQKHDQGDNQYYRHKPPAQVYGNISQGYSPLPSCPLVLQQLVLLHREKESHTVAMKKV